MSDEENKRVIFKKKKSKSTWAILNQIKNPFSAGFLQRIFAGGNNNNYHNGQEKLSIIAQRSSQRRQVKESDSESEGEEAADSSTIIIRFVPMVKEKSRNGLDFAAASRKRKNFTKRPNNKISSRRSIFVPDNYNYYNDYIDDGEIDRQGFSGVPPHTHGSGFGVSAALFATVPLLLIAGLALGYLARGTGNDSVTGSINNTNIIHINGSTITNTFTGNNDNTNNDADTITNTNNNNDNTNGGRRRKRSVHNEPFTWSNYELALSSLLGISLEEIPIAVIYSIKSGLGTEEIFTQSAALSRRTSCAKYGNKSDSCVNRLICEHFSEDHLIYGGHLFMRIAEELTASMASGMDLQDVSVVMDDAVGQRCELNARYSNCSLADIEDCLNVL